MGGVGGEKRVNDGLTSSNKGRIGKLCLLKFGSLEHLQPDKCKDARLPNGGTVPAASARFSRCFLRSVNEVVTGSSAETGMEKLGKTRLPRVGGLGRGKSL